MKIFCGPPGTGKTYAAAAEAVSIIHGGKAPSDRAALNQAHRDLVAAKRIWWVTFHPSYAYEDFVEGFRPLSSVDGGVRYEVIPGPFKLACAECRSSARVPFQVGEVIGITTPYTVLEADSGGVALSRSTSRADRVADEEAVGYADYWTINHLKQHGAKPEELSVSGKYNDQKQALAVKYKMNTTFWGNSSRHRALWEELERRNVDGSPQPVVLVIDEINRADLSRVFGELITLLEADKRAGGTEAREVMLPYSKQTFQVPGELSIVATMNTADRSLSAIDLALRRRFEFVAVEPEPALCPGSYGGVDVQHLLGKWNERISLLRSRDYRIGHAELMKEKLEATRKRHWAELTEVEGQCRAVAYVIRHKVLPLLMEYFPERWQRTDAVLGGGLLTGKQMSPAFSQVLGKIGEDVDQLSFEIPDWWNPNHKTWDGEFFRARIAK